MKIFFIVGVQRSGTTLLSVMLSKHPEIHLDSKSIAFRIVTCFNNYYDLYPHNLQHSKRDFLAWLIEQDKNGRLAELIDYKNIDQYPDVPSLLRASIDKKAKSEGKMHWGDKSPNLQHFLPRIRMLIPEAKIIHIIRDGRANAYSLHNRAHQNIVLSAQNWVDGNVYGLVNKDMVGKKNYKIIQYEKMLENPEGIARELCDFLEIPFTTAMLDLADDNVPEEQRYVKSTFDRSKIDQYLKKISPKKLRKIERIQGPLLQRLGYKLQFPEELKRSRQLTLRKRIWLNQLDNFKSLFRGKRVGMIDRENVEVKISWKSRIYNFIMVFIRDLVSLPIFKSLFPRIFYQNKYFKKEDQ